MRIFTMGERSLRLLHYSTFAAEMESLLQKSCLLPQKNADLRNESIRIFCLSYVDQSLFSSSVREVALCTSTVWS